jgi:hypothetical protein
MLINVFPRIETSQNSFVGFVLFFFTIPFCPFLFHNTLACVFFFTLLPVIKLIEDHWHDQDIICNHQSLIKFIILIDQQQKNFEKFKL